MLSSPIVTVVVPGRDVEAYAGEAIASLQAQTLTSWHAILIDDGSVDGTGTLFHEAAMSDDRFTLVRHPESRGLGAARNAALDLVTTKYVAFLDADDVMQPDALERTVASLERTGSDLAVGQYVRLRFDGGAWLTGDVQPWVAASTTPARVRANLSNHPTLVGNIVAWSKVSRLDLWHRTGVRFPEGVLYEDQVATQQLYVAARGIDLLETVLVQWRIRAEGASITQREADTSVFTDCVTQMRAGLAVLQEANAEATAARTTQILRMDLPRLAQAAATPQQRALLSDFARSLNPTSADLTLRTQSPANPNDPSAPMAGEVFATVTQWRDGA